MRIEQINGEDLRITCETQLDEDFWKEIKRQLAEFESTEKSLMKEVKHLKRELSYERNKTNA
jgi:hypothetical protein